ncbi:polysaccharide deacetylase family protein [Luteimonas viscosa]|uniref:Polysaccharide deacetylase family protein n=1 Tax=Luteimonas viscosa TaxID=1132694 RepID=A0A5D4XQK4_9GAMM|nr:polysaccharide deacetylase family protein [Luteimonas viscosa]TYT26947.1 polysaccharide deacetylase family protein [Luteimonas viscosa]
MPYFRFAVCGALLLSSLACAAQPASFAWPGGQRAAVSLSYDDAVPSQLDNAIPALDRHGLKGTFYLTLGADTVRERLQDWRAAARNGHELGNHSLFHQCSAKGPGREWVQPEQDLDATTVAQMRAQVELANAMLHAIDGSTEFTYTAPCGDRLASDGNYIDAVAPLFLGIKLVGGAAIPDMQALDRSAVPVTVPVDMSGAELIALVEEAGRLGTMINFTFHGIGGDHLSISNQAHGQLLAFLAEHRDRYWTATFREQMRWVRDRQAQAAAGDTEISPPAR